MSLRRKDLLIQLFCHIVLVPCLLDTGCLLQSLLPLDHTIFVLLPTSHSLHLPTTSPYKHLSGLLLTKYLPTHSPNPPHFSPKTPPSAASISSTIAPHNLHPKLINHLEALLPLTTHRQRPPRKRHTSSPATTSTKKTPPLLPLLLLLLPRHHYQPPLATPPNITVPGTRGPPLPTEPALANRGFDFVPKTRYRTLQ